MADITGRWEFHDECPAGELVIGGVAANGDLVNAAMDGDAVQGHYDAATDAIRLIWALLPQAAPFDTFVYDGYAIVDANGTVCGLAGTYHGVTLRFGPPFRFVYFNGGWYATYEGPIIG